MSSRQDEPPARAMAIRTIHKAAQHQRSHHGPRTLTGAQALDAITGDGLASNVGPMQEQTVPTTHGRRAADREGSRLRTKRRRDPNNPDDRRSQMLLLL